MRSWRESLYRVGLGVGGLIFLYQMGIAYQSLRFKPSLFVSPLPLVGAVVVSIAVSLMQFGIWLYLMGGLGVSIPWRQAMKGYALSMLIRYIPGGFWGYLSRSQWLYQSYGIPYGVSNTGSALEILGLIVAGGVIALGYWGEGVPNLLRWGLFWTAVFLPFGVWLVMRVVLDQRLTRWFSNRGLGIVCTPKITLRHWLIAVTTYLIMWLCLGGSILLVTHALDLSSRGGIGAATFVFVAAWILGFLFVFIPAGLGIRELALSSLMTSTLGILPSSAAVLSVVVRFTSLVAEACYLLGVTMIESIRETDK